MLACVAGERERLVQTRGGGSIRLTVVVAADGLVKGGEFLGCELEFIAIAYF